MFQDRSEAGKKLSEKLEEFKNSKEAIILAIPRGGVVVGYEIAHDLGIDLDIIIVKKIGAPENSEYAVGAVDENGNIIKNPDAKVSADYFKKEAEKEKKEIKKRIKLYRGNKSAVDLRGKTVILVDDGIATGLTILKAIDFIKLKKPEKIILATPVISYDAIDKLKKHVDKLIYIYNPRLFFAVGQYYHLFPQITDSEAEDILKRINK